MSQVVMYVHGFGVKKDARGLFSQISEVFPDSKHVLVDLNTFNDGTRELFVADLDTQKTRLQQAYKEAKQENPGAVFDLVCHSQGCLVAGLARLPDIRKIALLAPPSEISVKDMSRMFSGRPGTHINISSESRLSRRDGSTTVVPPEYWASIKNLNIIGMFNRLVDNSQVLLIKADEDEVIGVTDFSQLNDSIEIKSLPGDHNFSGDALKAAIECVKEFLDT